MVFFFQPRGYGPGKGDWLVYMGKDKYENEDLIKYGLPTDVWFHVDDMSSAHVYLRMPNGTTIDSIPETTLEDCVQLVKQNSIQGCKTNNVDVVYTLWENLKKTQGMEVGQVGFHSQKAVRKVRVEKKCNDIINRLNKTKVEAFPDLQVERQQYDKEISRVKKSLMVEKQREEKAARERARQEQELRSYKGLLAEDNMVSSKQLAEKYASAEDYEDDFM